jgi:hypothetical protein
MSRGLPRDQSIECPACGEVHRLSTMALVIVVRAFVAGDAQVMRLNGKVETLCLKQVVSEHAQDYGITDRVLVA